MLDKDAPVSELNKRIARHVAKAFGGAPRVNEYLDRPETRSIGILYSRDRPGPGVTAYSTIRLSDHPMMMGAREYPTRLELAGLCVNSAAFFPNVLAAAAFSIMSTDLVYYPGAVLPGIVHLHVPTCRLPHLFLAPPFPWEQELGTFKFAGRQVSWLLAVPISDSEFAFLKEHGDAEFEGLLERKKTDFSDPNRHSLV